MQKHSPNPQSGKQGYDHLSRLIFNINFPFLACNAK